ncbi:MAG: metallophosphoesterase family protein [Angustibacter sp.]
MTASAQQPAPADARRWRIGRRATGRPRSPLTSPQGRRLLRRAAIVVTAVLGFLAGAALAPAAQTTVGPLTVDVRVRPSVSPGAAVELPPVGSVRFDTHDTPVAVLASIRAVDVDSARGVIDSPAQLERLADTAPDVVRAAAGQALASSLLCGVAGAVVLSVLLTRRRRGVALGLTGVLTLVVGLGAVTAATFDPAALAQPRFTGVLSSAPYVQRRTATLAERLESYRSGLADFVQSVTTLYAVGQRLPRSDAALTEDVTTVLHVSDLHLNPLGFDLIDRLVEQFDVDAVVDTGDLSTWGSEAEGSFVNRIGSVGVPYVFVRGNHDSPFIGRAVATRRGAVVLDGQVATVAGLRIAGVADPRDTANEGPEDDVAKDEVQVAVQRLADVVARYDAAHPDAPVQLALVHDPTRLDPLIGRVPLVLSGHLHERRSEYQDGTRVLIEGSTGGAGLTSTGLRRLTDGDPVPLQASLLYFARGGPDAGRLLATDEVTIGGLGLTSVSIDRTLVPRDQIAPPSPTPSLGPGPSSTTPSGPARSASPTGTEAQVTSR